MAKKRRSPKRRKPAKRKRLTSCASSMGRKGGTVTKAKRKGIFSATYKRKLKAAKKTARKLHQQLKMF